MVEREEFIEPQFGHQNHHHHQHELANLPEGSQIGLGQTDQHMSMMKMYFHFGLNDLLLFPNLTLDSNLKLWLACLILFSGSILLEALRYLRRLRCRCELPALNQQHQDRHRCQSSLANGAQDGRGASKLCCGSMALSPDHQSHCKQRLFQPTTSAYRLLQASLHALSTCLGLTIMLAAMTYNLCLIFAIVLGAGVGFYLFQRPDAEPDTLCH